MTNEKHDSGGTAFPVLNYVGNDEIWQAIDGMTLWDYFAAAALTGLLAQGEQRAEKGTPAVADWYARVAGDVADCMIAERKNRMGGV